MDRHKYRKGLSLWQPQRKAVPIRHRKLPTVRLGWKNRPRKRNPLIVRIWRKIRLRSFLRKLKEYYQQVVRDIVDAGASYEAFQQRLLMETTGTVPIGIGLNRFPTTARQRAIIM
ncbi:hypothetical protein MLD38_007152 [Melastoma candidum]|uniref:Uncharacterized protein n=1 Tax=Melastoma candidum TaxID=119954 RepID=A0ACB9RTZ0_9MYRT|nr:hypothetical protein MLD38_007152 [Melastoma candidum]